MRKIGFLKSSSKFVLIFSSAFMTLFCSFVAYVYYSEVAAVKEWQAITATVVSSTIEQDKRTKGTTYCPIVLVKYEVQGKPYTSELEISNGPCSPARYSVSRTIGRFNPNTPIGAFVNPANLNQVRIASFSLGFGFYLMAFLALLFIWATISVIRTPTKTACM